MSLSLFSSWTVPLGLALIIPSVHFLYQNFSLRLPPPNSCRCFPGDECWPSKFEWDEFNSTVNGRLLATIPIASVCHDDGFLPYSAEACAELQSVWNFPETHCASSSSVMAPFFANRSCEPFSSRSDSCSISSLVQYVVNVSDISHYQKTLQFVKERNIRFVIRNTGHDWYAKSNGPGGLAVWTHHLKNMEMLDWKSPEYEGKAVKMGAGVQTRELYQFLGEAGYVTPAGNSASVGVAGGYTQGGGHGPLASAYGLAADQVLEWEVVDGRGNILKANQDENQDLYWALSGGGGGTYGIVWSLTSKAYPDVPTTGATLQFTSQGSTSEKFWDVFEAFITSLPAVTDAGVSAVWLAMEGMFALTPMLGPGVSKAKMEELLRPTTEKLEKHGIPHLKEFPSFLPSYDAMVPPTNASNFQLGGRLIPRSVVENNITALMIAFRNIAGMGLPLTGITANVGHQAQRPDNSVSPAWRDAIFSFAAATFWDNVDWEKNIENQRLMTNVVVPQVEVLTPAGGAAYLNEGNPMEPDWKRVFYGENYARLRSVKAKYDPDEMFYGLTAVGSDEWKQGFDGRLCRV